MSVQPDALMERSSKSSMIQDRRDTSNAKKRKPSLLSVVIGFGLVLGCIIGIFTSSTAAIAGVWCIAMMIVLMFLSVPVGIAISIPSIIGLYGISGLAAVANVLQVAPYSSVSSWSYSVLPMFIFMGLLLVQSGMTGRIYRATELWFGWLPGGLGIGTTAAGAGLASVSGSTIGMTYTLARAGIPEMLRAGYDKRFAVSTVLVAGLPGALIPPSILMVVYAGLASVAVGPQLIAGALPGILVAVTFSVAIFLVSLLAPRLVGKNADLPAERAAVTWSLRFRALGRIWGLPAIMIVLFGGIFSGLFTPTEAGAAAALMSVILTLIHKWGDRPFEKVANAAVGTVAATAAIFLLIIGAELLTRLMATTGIANLITEFIINLGLSRLTFVIVLIVVYVIMGMFFDTLSMMLLTIPVLLPTLEVMDIDLLWFGVFVVFLGELAMLTPPVGILSYIVHGITKNPEVNLGHKISLGDIFTALLWALPVIAIFLFLMVAFPEMATWLPSFIE